MSPKTRLRLHDAIMFVMPRAILKRMRTCRQIAQELAYPQDKSMLQRADLKFHLFICNSCHVLAKDWGVISEVIDTIGTKPPSASELAFTERMVDKFGKNSTASRD